jgi:hypothetical protein
MTSTTDEIIEYATKVNLAELVVRCIIFENEVKMKDFKSNLICGTAIDQGVITKIGGVFKILIKDQKIIFQEIKSLPCLQVLNNQSKINFRIFANSEEANLLINNFISTSFPDELNSKNSKFSSDLSFLTQEDIENQLDVFFKETPHIPESINDKMLFVGDQHDKLLLFREYQNRFDQQVDELMRRNFEDYVIDTCSDIFYEYKYEEIELKEREISRQAELSESSNQECLIS